MPETRTETIARLNDMARMGLGNTRTLMTGGITAMGDKAILEIIEAVTAFDAFTEDNNPWGERDFGSFQYKGEKIYWKIDYYDNDLQYGSEDPADPAKTCRVLTILLSSEY